MKKIFLVFVLLSFWAAGGYACSGDDPVQGGKEEVDPTPDPDPDPDPDPSGPKEYYVAVDGKGSGSLADPFGSINAALAVTRPGDVVYVRGGVYSEAVRFTRSGTADAPIVLKAYGDETPVISGEGMTWASGPHQLVLISGVDHVTVEGFEVTGLETDDGRLEANGITVSAGATNITLRNNHVHHIRNTAPRGENIWPGAHGILIIGNTDKAVRNVTVDGNRIHDCVTGFSETLTINGFVDGFTISNNTIYHCSNIAIDAAGGYAANPDPTRNYARNGVICGNVLYGIENSRGELLDGGFGAIAIYADGSRNITIERNRIFGCDRGIGVVSETDDYPTTDCYVRNNVVYDCWRTGIYMGGYLNYTTGGSENCYVVNNTLYANNRMEGAFGEIEGEIRLTENCRKITVANNLVCTTRAEDLFVHKYTATGSDNVFENNYYCGPGAWMWEQQDSSPITDFAAWQAASGGDAEGGYDAVPFFDFEPAPDADFSIGDAPALKNRGKALPAYFVGTVDFAGNPRTEEGKVSIGAFQ